MTFRNLNATRQRLLFRLRSPFVYVPLFAVVFLLAILSRRDVTPPAGANLNANPASSHHSQHNHSPIYSTRANIQQEYFCNILGQLQLTTQQLVHTRFEDGRNFQITVHAEGDAGVSDNVAGSGVWENENTRQLLWGLSLVSDIRGKERSAFLDIGANIGWFSLMVARRGHQVSAIEPSPRNQLCIRRTACMNSEISKHLTLYAMGVSEEPDTCHLYTQERNNGNAMLECGKSAEAPKSSIQNKYEKFNFQASIQVQTLDDILGSKGDNKIGTYGALKLDVEGLEPDVMLGGAQEVFASGNAPPLALMEFNPLRLGHHPKHGNDVSLTLKLWDRYGYNVYLDGYFPSPPPFAPEQSPDNVWPLFGRGQHLKPEDFSKWVESVKIGQYPDVFMIHRSFLEEVENKLSSTGSVQNKAN